MIEPLGIYENPFAITKLKKENTKKFICYQLRPFLKQLLTLKKNVK